jgi:hypothetical protein
MTKKKAPSPFKINFQVRDAVSKETMLPFINDLSGSNFYNINDTIPIVNALEKTKTWKARNFGLIPSDRIVFSEASPNTCELIYKDESFNAYQKVIHILDAYRVLRYGETYPQASKPLLWTQFDVPDHVDIHNQAYVDIAASYLASCLHTQLKSPHFTRFFQAFRAIAKEYKLNLSEDISSYRYSNWFWNAYDKNYFTLEVREKATNRRLTEEEALELLRPAAELCEDSDDEDEDENENETNDEEYDDALGELEACGVEMNQDGLLQEIKSVDSLSTKSGNVQIIHRHNARSHSATTEDEYGGDGDDEEFDAYTVHGILKDMPVAVLHTELMDGIMDDLLEHESFEDGWELRWTAWCFQVIAALQQLQGVLNIIHNDLHTNNILWKDTDDEFFNYKTSNGSIYKVPTYGKRFVCIDFGRATFNFNGIDIISSDFKEGRDAYGQYNYGYIRDYDESAVRPNPSFDLARLGCSLLRGLYPQNPPDKKGGGTILSEEEDWVVRETSSELFNMIWKWLVDENGENILETKHGEEKFPGFDLYQHIAANCNGARPGDWITRPIFNMFKVKEVSGPIILVP